MTTKEQVKQLINEIRRLIMHAENDTLHYPVLEHARQLVFQVNTENAPIKQGQTIERVTVHAYLEATEIQVPIDVLIRNDDVYGVDLKGWCVRDFNSLVTDVTEGLRRLGYRTYSSEPDRITMSYFESKKLDAGALYLK